jgi:hypothetical protein
MTWELHSHHLGGIVDVLHDDLTLEAYCRACSTLVTFWVGPRSGFRPALHDMLDAVAEHCGSHAVETDLADIQGLLACCLR